MQRLTTRINGTHPSSIAAAALATATCCCVSTLLGGKSSSPDGDARVVASARGRNDGDAGARIVRPSEAEPISTQSSFAREGKGPQTYRTSSEPMILASSPVADDAHSDSRTNRGGGEDDAPGRNALECDYVVIGHGKAGRSAVRTIRRLDPTADVVVIDPNNKLPTKKKKQRGSSDVDDGAASRDNVDNVQHLPSRASYIDHSRRLIHVRRVASSSGKDDDAGDGCDVVRYRRSALVATGSRGAPPPEGCIRHDAWSRILELRSTGLPHERSPSESSNDSAPPGRRPPPIASPIPVLDPSTVRSISIMAASQGARVAIMGGGFEALELAAYCARVSSAAAKQTQTGMDDDEMKVMLLFGNSGPMSNLIPRYLSAAITKRLRLYGVDVEERAMTRYISMDTQPTPQLELYTVKSYDNLDSRRMLSDLLVLAPSVDGLAGTAAIPAAIDDPHARNDHVPWSSLISPPLLACHLDDGRVATDSEFHAASSLYAAGSAARSPSARTGRAEVAGGRNAHAGLAGEAAARSMVRDGNFHRHRDEDPTPPLGESIPVWRSDVVPYLPADRDAVGADGRPPEEVESASTSLALYSMGVHALCVGRCDSEGMATHGFWWTNTSGNQSNESKKGDNGNGRGVGVGGGNGGGKSAVGPNAFMRRATRRTNNNMPNSRANNNRGSLPVYGSGVVFYLDRSGNIEGIMLWGLPYSQNSLDVHTDLNEELVERMKGVIRSNGGAAIRDHSEKILSENSGANVDVELLSYLHLVEESKHLASMALSGASVDPPRAEGDRKGGPRRAVGVLGKPLHRYTPTKPAELTNLGKLSRKDESGNAAEEDDLFYPTTAPSASAEESGRPPSLKRIYPLGVGAVLAGADERRALGEASRRRMRAERSRPSKEDPLWLRRGDEGRFVNRSEAMADAFHRNIRGGRFRDGSDALKQAPVPQAYLDAKEKWNSWKGAEGDDDEEEEDRDGDPP